MYVMQIRKAKCTFYATHHGTVLCSVLCYQIRIGLTCVSEEYCPRDVFLRHCQIPDHDVAINTLIQITASFSNSHTAATCVVHGKTITVRFTRVHAIRSQISHFVKRPRQIPSDSTCWWACICNSHKYKYESMPIQIVRSDASSMSSRTKAEHLILTDHQLCLSGKNVWWIWLPRDTTVESIWHQWLNKGSEYV